MRFILREGRLEDLKSKNPLLFSEIDELASSDPSGNLKYLDWEVKQLKNGFSVNNIVPTVQVFHRKQGKFKNRDINVYKTLKELEDEVKEIESTKTGSEARKEAKAGADTVYEDDDVIVKFIPSKEASCQYGKNTKWCITMRDHSYFEQYSGANVVFYFAMRKMPLGDKFDKVAIVVMRDNDDRIENVEFYDATDEKYTEIVEPLTSEIVDAAKAHAAEQPKGLLAKIKSSEATEEEELKAIEMYPDSIGTFVDFVKSKKALTMLAKDESVRSNVAQNPNTSAETLTMLAKDEDYGVRRGVAQNPNAPIELLTMLAKDKDSEVRRGVSLNTNISLELLKMLAKDEDLYVRRGVTLNLSTPSEILMLLAKNKDYGVRRGVAENPNTPSKALVMLAKNEELYIRLSVVSNPNTPSETLTMLAKDKNLNIRFNVALNPNTPSETLTMLAKDEDSNIRMRAKANLKVQREQNT